MDILLLKSLQKKKNEWKGNLTKDTLLKVYSFNRENSSQEDEDIENDEAYSKIQGIMDIRDLINEAFSPADEYDYYQQEKMGLMSIWMMPEQNIQEKKKHIF